MTHRSPLVVMMGVSGSGKTTVGAALAQRLRVPFADADDFHPPANIAKMTAGHALDDDDRLPWLEAIGEWLAEHAESGGVMSCSALKRTYRDLLRRHAPHGRVPAPARQPRGDRRAVRPAGPGHFMPASLIDSQFATLEPLAPDEPGLVIDVDQSVDAIVEAYIDQHAHHPPQQQTRHDTEQSCPSSHSPTRRRSSNPVASGWQLVLAALLGIALIVVLDHLAPSCTRSSR